MAIYLNEMFWRNNLYTDGVPQCVNIDGYLHSILRTFYSWTRLFHQSSILDTHHTRPRPRGRPVLRDTPPVLGFRIAVVVPLVAPLVALDPTPAEEVLAVRPSPVRTLPLVVPRVVLVVEVPAALLLSSSSAFLAAASLRCCNSRALLSASCCFKAASCSISAIS